MAGAICSPLGCTGTLAGRVHSPGSRRWSGGPQPRELAMRKGIPSNAPAWSTSPRDGAGREPDPEPTRLANPPEKTPLVPSTGPSHGRWAAHPRGSSAGPSVSSSLRQEERSHDGGCSRRCALPAGCGGGSPAPAVGRVSSRTWVRSGPRPAGGSPHARTAVHFLITIIKKA